MKLSLKEFFISLSSLLDFLEVDLLSEPTNHCKRVALYSLKLGQIMKLSEEELFYLGILALLHDLGASKAVLINTLKQQDDPDIESIPNHSKAGAKLIENIPFLSPFANVILYHHERFDGYGIYGKKGDDIPLFSRIIAIADSMEIQLKSGRRSLESVIGNLVGEKGKSFSPVLVNAAVEVLEMCSTERLLHDDNILDALIDIFPDFVKHVDEDEILELTRAFSIIVDAKSPFTKTHSSGLAEKTEQLCNFYGFDRDKTVRMLISAHLHDIGKLAVPNAILEKNGKLTSDEYKIVKEHTIYTRQALSHISGWEDITDWASDHHEKLNGRGYPLGKSADELSDEAMMMACLDMYQALTEDRPYKKGFSLEKTLSILDQSVERGEIDTVIVHDLKMCFSEENVLSPGIL